MIKIDIRLDAHLIRAMTDLVKSTVESVEGRLAVETRFADEDPELRETWEFDLKGALKSDCEYLLNILQHHHFGSCEFRIDEDVAEGVLRACSAVRLKLSRSVLRNIPDEQLEGGSIDIITLPSDQQRCYACYLFLAGLQSLIIREMDPSCEEFDVEERH